MSNFLMEIFAKNVVWIFQNMILEVTIIWYIAWWQKIYKNYLIRKDAFFATGQNNSKSTTILELGIMR